MSHRALKIGTGASSCAGRTACTGRDLPQPEPEGHQSQVAHRGIGQDALEVGLGRGQDRREDGGARADHRYELRQARHRAPGSR